MEDEPIEGAATATLSLPFFHHDSGAPPPGRGLTSKSYLDSWAFALRAPQKEQDHTLLHLAAWSGDCAQINTLIDLGVNLDSQTLSGWAPLHFSARNGHVDCVIKLLDHGADPSLLCQGWTALHFAAWMDHLCCAIALVSRGADLCRRDLGGFDSIDVYGKYIMLIPPMSFAERKRKVTALLDAAEHYHDFGQPVPFSLG
jgi:ankyrin repeat protein